MTSIKIKEGNEVTSLVKMWQQQGYELGEKAMYKLILAHAEHTLKEFPDCTGEDLVNGIKRLGVV